MNHVLTDLAVRKLSKVDRYFAKNLDAFKRCLRELDAEIDPAAKPQRSDSYHHRVGAALQESQNFCRRFELENLADAALIKDVQHGFRLETALWLNRSWFINRARTKPSGFVGDYEMLSAIYNEATPARGLGGYVDLCCLDLPLARAVQSRLKATREFLIGETAHRRRAIRILNIACGPCRELLGWPAREDREMIEFVAMDHDAKALDYVDTHVTGHIPEGATLQTVRYNALRTRSARTTIRKFGRFDIIYSAGLCDYLPDSHLIDMLGAWRDTLSDGGVLYVPFKDCERYDKTPYQWHMDWFFFQRTQEDCLRLFETAGFDRNELEISRDETGIIIVFVNRSRQRQTSRVDVPEGVVPRLGLRSPLSTAVEPRKD